MGSAELVQALLAAGAKPALKNAHGDTAAAFAKRGPLAAWVLERNAAEALVFAPASRTVPGNSTLCWAR